MCLKRTMANHIILCHVAYSFILGDSCHFSVSSRHTVHLIVLTFKYSESNKNSNKGSTMCKSGVFINQERRKHIYHT